MDKLSPLLSSRVRAGIFRLLFGLTEAELHVRELARQSGLHEATVRQELRKLRRMDLVIERRDSNRTYYKANHSHPLYMEIHRIVLKTSGLVDVLRQALAEVDVDIAFVFGSVAGGTEVSQSDLDLMVIGKVGLRDLSPRLTMASDQIGREINPHVMTAAEYRRRSEAGDHFVTRVLEGPKLFVLGTEDELGRLVR